MLPAGGRMLRVRLERRAASAADALGNGLASWRSPIVLGLRWAGLRPQFGREAIEAGRLADGIVGVLTLPADPDTRTLTAADRVVVLGAPYADRIFEITAVLPTPDGREIELTVIETRP